MTLELSYFYAVNSDPPVPGPPIPPIDPPIPNPPVPIPDQQPDGADELIKEQKAVEKAREVVNEVIGKDKEKR